MKRVITSAFFIVGLLNLNFAQTVKIEKMPASVDEFVTLRNQIANTPEGGAAMFIIALKMYAESPEIGEKCLVIATDRSRLKEGGTYKGFSMGTTDFNRIKTQKERYPYVANSYFKSANPKNKYTVSFPAEMEFSTNAYSGNIADGNIKMFVKSSGADSARPIRMVKNNKGYWKASEWSTIVMGIKKPVEELDDDL